MHSTNHMKFRRFIKTFDKLRLAAQSQCSFPITHSRNNQMSHSRCNVTAAHTLTHSLTIRLPVKLLNNLMSKYVTAISIPFDAHFQYTHIFRIESGQSHHRPMHFQWWNQSFNRFRFVFIRVKVAASHFEHTQSICVHCAKSCFICFVWFALFSSSVAKFDLETFLCIYTKIRNWLFIITQCKFVTYD